MAELRLAPTPALLLAWLPLLELRLPLLELVARLELPGLRLPPELKLRLEPELELREEEEDE